MSDSLSKALLRLPRPQLHHLYTIMYLGCEEGPNSTRIVYDCHGQLKQHIFNGIILFL